MPYQGNHACRIAPPEQFQADSFRTLEREHEGKKYNVIIGKKKGADTMSEQSYRYPSDTWSVSEARTHCTDHDGILFEPAPQEDRATWYTIRNAKEETAEILIYDEIGASFWGEGVEAKKFVEDLRTITAKTINVRLNSPGGSVFDGFAIYNALRRKDARIVVDIDGMALSIASVIALAGHEVRMAKNALYMIHDPSGMTIGTADDMRSMAVTLDKIKENIVGVYHDRTLKPGAKLAQLMAEETWFTASEAKDMGFIDQITEERQVAAYFDLSRYKHPPQLAAFHPPLTGAAQPALEARRGRLVRMAQHARRR